MAINVAFNPPQFIDQYEGYKMRQLIDELERLHAALTRDVDEEGTPSTVDSFNGRFGDIVPIQADYDSFFLTPAEGDAAYAGIANVVNSFEGRQGGVTAQAGDYADVAEIYTVLETFRGGLHIEDSGGTMEMANSVATNTLTSTFTNISTWDLNGLTLMSLEGGIDATNRIYSNYLTTVTSHTDGTIVAGGTQPTFIMTDEDNTLDNKAWVWQNFGTTINFGPLTDAGNNPNYAMSFLRSGSSVTVVYLGGTRVELNQGTDLWIRDGAFARVYDSNDQDYIQLDQTSSESRYFHTFGAATGDTFVTHDIQTSTTGEHGYGWEDNTVRKMYLDLRFQLLQLYGGYGFRQYNSTNAQYWQSSVNAGAVTYAQLGINSVAFPALGTGGYTFSDTVAATEFWANQNYNVVGAEDSGVFSGYNIDSNAAVVSHLLTGAIAGVRHDNQGVTRFYNNTSQTAGTTATPTMTINNNGVVDVVGNITVSGTVDGKDVSTLIASLVEDTSPQLGGSLDTNNRDINFRDGNWLTFGDGGDVTFQWNGTRFTTTSTAAWEWWVQDGATFRLYDSTDIQYWQMNVATGAVNYGQSGINDVNFPALGTGAYNFGDNVDVTGNITVTGTVDGKDVSTLIANVVEDTTPQLGGNLASNGFDIQMAANDVVRFSDGVDNLSIFADATSGNLEFVGTGGFGNVDFGGVGVQIGNLYMADTSFIRSLTEGSHELVGFDGVASAVNYLEIANSITAQGPELRAAGSDINIDLELVPKGTGLVRSLSGLDVTGNITVSGTVDGRDVATDGTKLDGIESGATADQTAGEIEAIVNHDNLLGFVANEHIDWTLASQGTIHITNFVALQNVVEDTTPQLGGNLASNGFDIQMAANDVLRFSDGADTLSITADSISGNLEFVGTGGFGNVDFGTVGVQIGNLYMADTGFVRSLTEGSHELLGFDGVASAVNYLQIANSITGAGPELRAAGSDVNIDLELVPKGTGIVRSLSGLDVTGNISATGTLTSGTATVGNSAQALSIKGGASDHAYIAFFADAAAQGTRSAYMGFPSVGSEVFTFKNEFAGGSFSFLDNVDFIAGIDVTGNITVTGTVDGVDIAARDHDAVTIAGQDFLSLAGQVITANAINLDNLSATGTPSASTYLRGDNTWATVPGGLANVVEDTTPQLGGNLDSNNFNINMGPNDSVSFSDGVDSISMYVDSVSGNLQFTETGGFGWVDFGSTAVEMDHIRVKDTSYVRSTNTSHELLGFNGVTSAVNYLEIANSITGAGPELRAVGTDANVNLELVPKGTGEVAAIGPMSVSGLFDLDGNILRIPSAHMAIRNQTAGAFGVRLENSASAIQGYLYADGSQTFGLLHSGGGWALQIAPASAQVTFPGLVIADGGIRLNDSDRLFFGTSSAEGDMYSDGVDIYLDMNAGVDFRLRGGAANDNMIIANADSSVVLYFNNSLAFATADTTVTGQTSSADIYDVTGTVRDVGFNVLPTFNFNVSDTLERRHSGHITGKDNTTAYTLTGPTSADLDFPVGGVCQVVNLGTSINYTISDTTTCTMYYCDGSAAPVDIVGSGTLAPGGWISLWRYSATAIYITGSGFTP